MLSTQLRRGATVAALAVGSLTVTGVGITLAAIPDSHGVIHACRTVKTGAIRIIDPSRGQRCHTGEARLSWSQKGPRGATGATGPVGPQGVPGAQGPAGPASIDSLQGTACAGQTDYTFPNSWAGKVDVQYPVGGPVALMCAPTLWHLKLNYLVGFGNNTSSVTFSSPSGVDCTPGGPAHGGCAEWVPEARNSQVTLTVYPSSGVTGWTWSGACSGSATTCVVTMDQDLKTVTISFTGS